MSRLVTFGCSFTYGHGLPDCLLDKNIPGPHPSKFSWPALLGKMMDREVVNLSEPGSSNTAILLEILNTKFEEDDIVIILWAHHSRNVIFFKDYEDGCIELKSNKSVRFIPIGNWMTDEKSYGSKISNLSKNFYLAHREYDLMIKDLLIMNHAEHYLNNIPVKNFQFHVNSKFISGFCHSFLACKNMKDLYLYDIMFTKFPLANDNSHPGLQAHNEMAKEIFKAINE